MKRDRIPVIICCFVFYAFISMSGTVFAEEEFPVPTSKDLIDTKKFYDDPTPWYISDKFAYKKVLPPEVYSKLCHDVETMKEMWSEIVGFKAPDVVNKIAPEIKPGTYSYKDKGQLAGLKALMTEHHYNRFKPGAPPLACNFPEIKIVPTRQYYYSLPVSEATRKNAGQTKLNEETGIIKEESYISGYPFPKPEGKFKATEAYYNWMKRYWTWDSRYQITEARGWRRSLKEDFLAVFNYYKVRLQGRVTEPIGWFDQRAKEQGEFESYSAKYFAPRDMFGNVVNYVLYSDPEKNDHLTMYVSTLRRVRLLSATDAQDAVGGGDGIYLDTDGCVQKPSLTVYPSKLELIGEREILFPSNNTGTAYVTSPSKGLEYLNLEWERRPVYIIKMQVLDKNFVYSYRIMYMDKETFLIRLVENYDQKGRLYRTTETIPAFIPEMGVTTISDTLLMDHIDLHSTLGHNYIMPTPWLGREAIGLEYLFTTGK